MSKIDTEVYPKIPTYVRQSVGQKKIAPINMRKEEHQFVIDGYLIDEVLRQIPDEIHILSAEVWLIKREPDQQLTISTRLRKLGITRITQSSPFKQVRMGFDAVKKSALRRDVLEACTEFGIPFIKAYFGSIVLSNGTGAGKFKHCTKEIHPDATDKRKKLRVLGLITGQGKVQGLVTDLGAKKFKCTIKEEAVKMIMCSRE